MAQHLRECSYFLLLVEDTLQEQHTMRGEILVRSKLFFLKPVEHCHDTTRLSCITGQCVCTLSRFCVGLSQENGTLIVYSTGSRHCSAIVHD